MPFPRDLKYTRDHEWTRLVGGEATVGVTAFAVEQLGDITMVELPKVGAAVRRGESMGTIESVKTVSDLFAPLSGAVAAVNAVLADAPQKVNEDPYGEGWIVRIAMSDASETVSLLDAETYGKLVAEG
ncbi:MAG: glycine cleavage system protein GcvH [Myxococcota bacterium]|nr:glycine cleavage system protein GcvH [Myxococcota bacterium]